MYALVNISKAGYVILEKNPSKRAKCCPWINRTCLKKKCLPTQKWERVSRTQQGYLFCNIGAVTKKTLTLNNSLHLKLDRKRQHLILGEGSGWHESRHTVTGAMMLPALWMKIFMQWLKANYQLFEWCQKWTGSQDKCFRKGAISAKTFGAALRTKFSLQRFFQERPNLECVTAHYVTPPSSPGTGTYFLTKYASTNPCEVLKILLLGTAWDSSVTIFLLRYIP